MFKKTKIAAATVALLSIAAVQNASAVAVDESGNHAQVLIFPYYNTNNGFISAYNIRNTSDDYKAVKVRFRESKLSNDVLDFNVYMSPKDHFSISVGVNAEGKAFLNTADKTCTYPAIPAAGVAFKGDVYTATKDVDAREGYLEVIEMGVVDKNATVGVAPNAKKITEDGILHVAGVPKDCSLVAKAWNDGVFTEGGANAVVNGVNHEPVVPGAILRPTGGLQGWSFLLDYDKGNANVAMPAAIRNYQTAHGQHYLSSNPDTFLLPSLASGNRAESTVMDNGGTSSITTTWLPAPDFVLTTLGQAEVALANGGAGPKASGVNPFPIAHVLAATGLTNDYLVTTTGDSAGTDWVITFPMRKHGINAIAGGTSIPMGSGTVFYGREEEAVSVSTDGFSPVSSTPATTLTREVNILSFAKTGNTTPTNVLRSEYVKPYGVDYASGWGTIVYGGTPASDGAHSIGGVPTIGFAAIRGNYKAGAENVIGESIPHTFLRNRTPAGGV